MQIERRFRVLHCDIYYICTNVYVYDPKKFVTIYVQISFQPRDPKKFVTSSTKNLIIFTSMIASFEMVPEHPYAYSFEMFGENFSQQLYNYIIFHKSIIFVVFYLEVLQSILQHYMSCKRNICELITIWFPPTGSNTYNQIMHACMKDQIYLFETHINKLKDEMPKTAIRPSIDTLNFE